MKWPSKLRMTTSRPMAQPLPISIMSPQVICTFSLMNPPWTTSRPPGIMEMNEPASISNVSVISMRPPFSIFNRVSKCDPFTCGMPKTKLRFT